MMKMTMKNSPVVTLDPEALRSAMRAWSAGVTVVAAEHDGQRHGMTVNSFTTISLQSGSRTHELIEKSRAFGLTILSAGQTNISDVFAGRVPDVEDRFLGLLTETLVTGSPLISDGLAWLDCRIVETFTAGMNTLFIAEVVAARGTGSGDPLIYHNRGYWKLSRLE
jgi:flavin reductase (DIM6/NTAB) family NADH-FMN oxidoreductase RutF